MTKITESEIERFAIELLKKQGYQYLYGPDIASGSGFSLRSSFDDVLLSSKLKDAIDRINPDISAQGREDALRQVQNIHSSELISANEGFHYMLSDGVNIITRKNGEDRGDYVKLIDFENPQNNEFNVVNQFSVIENHQNKRPDVILFVNGLPLVVIELKNPVDENATITSAYNQLQTYKQTISSLFTYNGILVIFDGLEARAGSLSAGFSSFMAWKTIDGVAEASHLVSQLEILINGMLNKSVLLDLIRKFTVFEKSKKEDEKTGITSIQTIKKQAAYHQYYAVNKALESVVKASADDGNRKGGVVWHTQGSGKSLSMVFTAGKIVRALNNPTILVITDRNDLDDQLFDTFASSKALLRQEPVQAKDRQHLKQLSMQKNIVVIADEAHRTQY